MTNIRLKYLLSKNEGGIWGDDPKGECDTPVLRSTEQNADGSWRLREPAVRYLTPSERGQYLLQEGDIVVTKSSGSDAHIGKSSIVDQDVASLEPAFSNFMQRLRVRKNVSSRFIWYVLNSSRTRFHYVVEATSTSGLGNLTGGIINKLSVSGFDLPTQKRIADFLDRETGRIDELMEKKERLGGLINRRRLSLITEAMSGKIGPAAELIASQVSPMPKVRLRFLLQPSPSAREIVNLTAEDEVSFAPMDALDDGLGGLDGSMPRRFAEVAAGSYNYFRNGDVLLAKVTPCFENGKKAIAQNLINGVGFATSEVHVFRPKPGKLDARFLIYQFSSEDFKAVAMRSMTGSGGLKRVSDAAILNYRPHFVDLDLQRKVVEFLDDKMKVFEVIKSRNKASIERLREYRAALITAAVTGQIDADTYDKAGKTSAILDRIEEEMQA